MTHVTHVTHVTLGESLDVWAQEKTEEKKAETKEEEKKLSFTKPRLCHKSCSSRMREPLPPVQVGPTPGWAQKPWWM